jgi:DNA-binding CsgD family transcriptional regulator/PAS domain-containing protein
VTDETAAFSKLVSDVYDAALDPALWTRALESACAFVEGYSAVLYWHDAASERSDVLHLFNDDEHYRRLYFEKYLPMNPVFPAATFIQPGVVYTPTDIVPENELIKTRFHREWVKPQGLADVVCMNLEKGATHSAVINIRRNEAQGPVDPETRRRAALIVPHFRRAISIARLFDQSRTAAAVLAETLSEVDAGVILVAAKGRIVFANPSARAMLEQGSLLRERNGLLAAVVPEAQRTLREIFTVAESAKAEAGGTSIPLSASPHQRWFAHVLPLTSGDRQRTASLHSAVAAVFIRNTSLSSPPPLERLAGQYSLTASEIRVLDGVMKVSSIRALAELLGLSQATVKTHLQNIFRKTGTNRQSDLVKLVAGFEPARAEGQSGM